MTELRDLAARLNAEEFDHVFTLHPDGSITDPSGMWAPSVYNDPDDDITIDGTGWTALRGLTQQDRYYGAVMHASEYIGPGIARYLLEMVTDHEGPLHFAVVVVECLPEDDDPEPEPAGWAIVYSAENA